VGVLAPVLAIVVLASSATLGHSPAFPYSFSRDSLSQGGSIPLPGYPIYIAYDPVNNNLYVTMQQQGSFNYSAVVVSTTTNKILTQIPLPYGVSTLAVDTSNGYVYVGDTVDTVYAINPHTERVEWKVPAGCPGGCFPDVQAFDPANDHVFATDLGNNNLSVFKGDSLISTFYVGTGPNGAAFDPASGMLFVANEGSYTLTAVNASSDSVVRSIGPLGPGPGVTYASSNGVVYVCENNASGPHSPNVVTGVDGSSLKIVSRTPIDSACGADLYNPGNNYVYVTDQMTSNGTSLSNVTLLDPNTGRIQMTLPTGLGPTGIAYDPANHEVYVADTYSESIGILPLVTRVTFQESGLPTGTNWSVSIGGTSYSSATDSISFPLVNGTYPYSVTASKNCTAVPSNGVFSTASSALNISVSFQGSVCIKIGTGLPGPFGQISYAFLGVTIAWVLIASVLVVLVLRRERSRD